eukprot:1191862-Pleurochrysis_carterae.AAC.1
MSAQLTRRPQARLGWARPGSRSRELHHRLPWPGRRESPALSAAATPDTLRGRAELMCARATESICIYILSTSRRSSSNQSPATGTYIKGFIIVDPISTAVKHIYRAMIDSALELLNARAGRYEGSGQVEDLQEHHDRQVGVNSELARGGDQSLGTGQVTIAHPSGRLGLGGQDE